VSAPLPSSRPKITRAEVEAAMVTAKHVPIDRKKYPVVVYGFRGYYRQSIGDPTKNDRNAYDDAICVDTGKKFVTFNANTDPSAYRHGIATLVQGMYFVHRIGLHKQQYTALVQTAGEVTVTRDGGKTERGYFGINIHRGGTAGTSSLGFQTIPVAQYDEFINLVKSAVILTGDKWRAQVVPYVLSEVAT
jgi:hypothetical protein